MRHLEAKASNYLCLALILSLTFFGSACQNTVTVTNTNANTATTNTNTTVTANTNTSLAVPAEAVINTREPQTYRATLMLTAQTEGGDRTVAIPQLSAEVARDGDKHRVSFKLPNNEQLIYLDRDNKHYVISPTRKQYAELTPEATGIQINDLMTPGQLVSYLEKQKGYEKVGEEQYNGRTAEKYRYAATAKTGTQAGDVKSETYAYVDKDTGLPLRFELFSEASGQVQGVKALHAVAEMKDIQTSVDPMTFDIPAGYAKIDAQQVRQQINAVTQIIGAVIGQLLKNAQTTMPTASPTPAATTSPTPAHP